MRDNCAMPWKEIDAMQEKVRFILEWERRWDAAQGGRVDVAELCRRFGVSRQTGYVWIKRFCEGGHDVRALEEKSRRPLTSPTAIELEMEDLVVAARKFHPRWGPRKLRAWLLHRYPGSCFPSASCMSKILQRRGLSRPRKRCRRRGLPLTQPFGNCAGPNDTWCIDFKGKFRTQDGEWCHVLTLLDAWSRYLLRCEVVLDPDGEAVERILDSAFQEFGLPLAMRSDNGPPFASTGAAGLTRLSVWWLQLGIRLERIEPGEPQQNGRLERAHLTLEEIVADPAENAQAQQRQLDPWRREYNEDRPHEALGQRPPAHLYEPSSRRYPRKLLRPEPQSWCDAYRVESDGCIRWRHRKLHVTNALIGESVTLERLSETKWEVRYGDIVLGTVNTENMNHGMIKRRMRIAEVSGMSLD
jgi:putative transposase